MNIDLQIDRSVFEHDTSTRCDDGEYKECIAINRLLTALRYYEAMNAINKQELFTHFVMDVYKHQILNDYHHLSKIHGDNIHDIHQYFLDKMKGAKCEATDCAFASRHHRVNEKQNTERTVNHNYALL